jgi:hypothetical protein
MSTPDGELIVLCAKFDQLEAQVVGLFSGPGKIADDHERDSAIAPIEAAQRELVHRICAVPAATIAGMQAKARSLVTWAPDRMKGCVFIDELLLASLLVDLTRERPKLDSPARSRRL